MKLDPTHGELSRTRKLSAHDVRAIRRMHESGMTLAEIRRRHYPQVSAYPIRACVLRITWRTVT